MTKIEAILNNKIVLGILLLGIALIYIFPIIKNIHSWGIYDWDLNLGFQEATRKSIVQYRQLPLWNPYVRGGAPLLADPQCRILAPTYFLSILFGTWVGTKMEVLCYVFIGMIGMYALLRFFRFNILTCYYGAFLFALSSAFSTSIAAGMIEFMVMAWFPLIYLFYLKSRMNKCYIPLAGLFLALVYFSGGAQFFPLMILTLIIDCLFRQQRKQGFIVLLGILILTFLLSGIKLIPGLELHLRYPRYIGGSMSGYTAQSLWRSLISHNQHIYGPGNMATPSLLGQKGHFLFGQDWHWDEHGCYIGILPLFFFFWGFFTRKRELSATRWTLFMLIWLSFGIRAPIDLWAIVKHVPPFDQLRVAQRWSRIFLTFVVFFSAMGFERFVKRISFSALKKGFLKYLPICLLAYVVVDLLIVCSPVFKRGFFPPPIIREEEEFQQISGGFGSAQRTVKENKGNIKAATSVPIRVYAISSESSSYRGEYYLDEQNGVITLEYWSPNKLIFRPKAISKDLLVINQNYFAGWKAKSATKSRKVINHNGLLATYTYPEDDEIIFYYFPGTFLVGTLVSILGIALSFLIWNKHDLFTLGDICLNEDFISKSTI